LASGFQRSLDHRPDPRDHRFARGRELGRQHGRRGAVAAEEQVEQLEHELAVHHAQRLAVGDRPCGGHRHRQPRGQPVMPFGAVIGKALHHERLGPAADLLAQQRFEHPPDPARETRGEMLQRVQIAERIELGRAEHTLMGGLAPRPLAPIGRRHRCRVVNHALTERRNW
jgi:hypothetical protein